MTTDEKRALIKKRIRENRRRRRRRKVAPQPRYDAIFYQGLAWLDRYG